MLSLTPHEDAARASIAQQRLPQSDLERSANAITDVFVLEMARAMDRGQCTNAAVSLAVSASATILDTVASSAATNEMMRVFYLNAMLGRLIKALRENDPAYVTTATVKHAGVKVGAA